MKGNYIKFYDVKMLLQSLKQNRSKNIFFNEVYLRILILIRLLFSLAFKIDRATLIEHIEKLIAETEKIDVDGQQDYSLVPLSPAQQIELEEISSSLVSKENKADAQNRQRIEYFSEIDF